VKHDHRAVVERETSEGSLELVAIDDRLEFALCRRVDIRQDTHDGPPSAFTTALGVAGAHEEPVRPGFETRRVAEGRKVPPDAQQRLLRRVLCQVDVAQDPVRHGMETVAGSDGQAREGLFVTPLRSGHQLGIHALPVWGVGFDSTPLLGMGPPVDVATQSSSSPGQYCVPVTGLMEQLDFLYMPSRDVAADARYFSDVLGGRLVFAVDGMGTRVAMVELTESPPRILLAGHLDGEAPILVYRVADLRAAMDELRGRGWRSAGTFEIPFGPICSFTAPGGQHIAIYERTRPEVEAHFAGRFDF
jgi:hypothetical protein